MGRLGLLKSFQRVLRGSAHGSEATVDPGGGANVAAPHFSSPGDDSFPLIGDYVVIVPGPGTGREQAVAYADPLNEPQAAAGEKRIYARDPSDGSVAVSIWLKADGSVVIDNGAGSITLGAAGTIDLNGVTIDPSGNITTSGAVDATSVVAAGNELAGHVHFVASTPGNSGPNL